MDYNNGFILQKKMVSSNRSVDWSLPNDGMTISVSACAPIFYFTRSQNNDSTNIIIISPNYHRIIHKNNPRFNRRKFQFEFENGEVMRLKLYEHLKA
jgi:hypothetical protein